MKRILLMSILFLFGLSSMSQNLTYSKVLLISSQDTVPQGKVWKITNVLQSLEGNGPCKIQVNGNDIVVAFNYKLSFYRGPSNEEFLNNHYNALQGAYWLPAGTILNTGINVEYISVIEFIK